MSHAVEAEPPAAQSPYAPRWRRAAAYLFDFGFLYAAGWWIGGFFFEPLAALGRSASILGLAIGVMYFGLLNSRLCGGATLGKRLLRIRVCDVSRWYPSLPASVLRAGVLLGPMYLYESGFLGLPGEGAWAALLSASAITTGTAYLALFHGPARRTLHDLVTGTTVVRATGPATVLPVEALHVGASLGVALAMTTGLAILLRSNDMRFGALNETLETLRERVAEATGAEQVGFFQGTERYFWQGEPSQHLDVLRVQVRLAERPSSDRVLNRITEVILLDHPGARALDAISVELVYGFDLFLSERYDRVSWVGTPAEWQTRIDPEPVAIPAQPTVDAPFKTLLSMAEAGNPEAMALVAQRLLQGSGEERARGLVWLDLAAKAGVPGAKLLLADMIRNGEATGTPEEAFAWTLEAAQSGLMEAQYRAGQAYAEGSGVEVDPVAAIEWYRKAVDQGHTGAMNNLGTMLARGQGFIPDRSEAARIYEAAAEAGDAHAQNNLAVRLADGDGVEKDEGRATYWLHRAAIQGHESAQYRLGLHYLNGIGTQRDTEEGLRWLERSARAGYAAGFRSIGHVHHQGNGVPVDLAEALRWYELGADAGDGDSALQVLDLTMQRGLPAKDPARDLARVREIAESGSASALYAVGIAYGRGHGVETDSLMAFSWMQRAANRGMPEAQTALAFYLGTGTGVRRNPQKSVAWLEKAAAQDFAPAQRVLGEVYLRGSDVPANPAKGVRYLKAAARNGDAKAEETLAKIRDAQRKAPARRR